MPQFPSYIFGMHDPGAEPLFLNANKPGWIVVSVQVNPPDQSSDFSGLANQGFGVIVRLNNGYDSNGTLPNSSQYAQFAQQCASFVAGSKGAKVWIVGNETNSPWERPGNNGGQGGEVITPALYAQCFALVRAAIKKLPGHDLDWVVPSAPAPWNNQTTYPGNANGDWVQYFKDTLNQCIAQKATPDGIAMHTYTHGMDPAFITSEEKMVAPFTAYHKHFRTYRDFMAAVPTSLKTAPVFITETQPADPDWWQDRNVGWVQAAFKEINDWNAVAANQPIQALCLFRWQTGNPQWSISDKNAVKADFQAALQNNYKVRWATPPPPPPPPPPQPLPATDPRAIDALAAAKKLTWMPINTDGALYKFAQSKNLGYPQTDEFEFTVGTDAYVGQVYNLGIVYVKKGDWANVKFVNKPAGM